MTTETFRKTATVEARVWDPNNPEHVLSWLDAAGAHYKILDGGRLGIGTLESGDDVDRHAAKPGDRVLQGIGGEFYACDAAIFSKSYEPSDASPTVYRQAATRDGLLYQHECGRVRAFNRPPTSGECRVGDIRCQFESDAATTWQALYRAEGA